MPKTAATITGLMLAACSIGFNTVRYPIVSEMVGPLLASAPPGDVCDAGVPPAASGNAAVPPAATADAQTATKEEPLPSAPAVLAEVKPVPDLATVVPDAIPPVAERTDKPAAAKDDDAAAGSTVPEKPLVPVSQAAVLGSTPAGGELAGAVRRLPPVDPNQPPPPSGRNWQSAGGAVPVYPSTGIK
jgi:hypothetical protein